MSAAVNLCKDVIAELKRKNRLLTAALGAAISIALIFALYKRKL